MFPPAITRQIFYALYGQVWMEKGKPFVPNGSVMVRQKGRPDVDVPCKIEHGNPLLLRYRVQGRDWSATCPIEYEPGRYAKNQLPRYFVHYGDDKVSPWPNADGTFTAIDPSITNQKMKMEAQRAGMESVGKSGKSSISMKWLVIIGAVVIAGVLMITMFKGGDGNDDTVILPDGTTGTVQDGVFTPDPVEVAPYGLQ